MTADCPAYDRERRMCLVHPDDCEFSPAGGEAALVLETLEVPTRDTFCRRSVKLNASNATINGDAGLPAAPEQAIAPVE